MDKNELLKFVETTELKDLAEVFAILAKRTYEHRKNNNGFVPREIFASCIGLGGGYLCAEIVVEVEGKGYALKKRNNSNEESWENQYQIPGCAVRITDNQEKVFARLSDEIFGKEIIDLENQISYLGCEIHDEPERLATCWTLMYKLTIQEKNLNQLSGEWKIFQNTDNARIIDHHRNTLKWASNPNRPLFADLRN